MVATGIVRRIDDLGRVVIPKEIRRALKINENDALEFWRDGDKLVLMKYEPVDEKKDAIETLQEWLKDNEQSAALSDIERMTFKMLLDKVSATNS